MKKELMNNRFKRRMLVKRVLIFCLFSIVLSVAKAQTIERGNCTPPPANDGVEKNRANRFALPAPHTNWDPNKTYRQLVVLISFSDTDFSMPHPRETYDSIFNINGYNQGNGPGCVADYYRDQSTGLFNVVFDVYGPFKVSTKAQPFAQPSSSSENYGREPMIEATRMLLAAYPELTFDQYDWNGNGYVNQVVYVSAGYSGNESSQKAYGYIWPNTSAFTTITTGDGKYIRDYSISAELWTNDHSCGIGTICHEYTHSLGLPDIYPTNGWTFSSVDEWDLMDGGNFTNWGWCPPNFSPMEKIELGWAQPIELTTDTAIVDLKPMAEGGQVYQVKHTETEFLLLENRQWRGWDYGLPGKGLVVYHVNYIPDHWRNNNVNNTRNRLDYCLIAADNMNYEQWEDKVIHEWGVTSINKTYRNPSRMNRYMLSSAAYPWTTDSTTTVVDSLTDQSVPAALMYNLNEKDSKLLSKPIRQIEVTADGLVAFDFMEGSHKPVGISRPTTQPTVEKHELFNLNGHRVSAFSHRGLYIERRADGTAKKVFK